MKYFMFFIVCLFLIHPLFAQDWEYKYFPSSDFSKYYSFTNICADSNNNIYATGGKINPSSDTYSIFSYNNDNWTMILDSGGNDMIVDSKNNLWVAMQGCIKKYDGVKWYSYKYSDTLDSVRDYTHIALDKKGNIWAITSSCVPYNQSVWEGTPVESCRAYYELLKFNGNSWERKIFACNLPQSFYLGEFTAIAMDKNDNIWLSSALNSPDVLIQYDTKKDRMTFYELKDKYSEKCIKNIIKLYNDSYNNLWVLHTPFFINCFPGYYGGIGCFKDSIWTPYTYIDSLRGDPYYDFYYNDIKQINDKTYMILAFNCLIQYNNKDSMQLISIRDVTPELQYAIVNEITIDKNGNIWIATNNGIVKITKNSNSINETNSKQSEIVLSPNPIDLSNTNIIQLDTPFDNEYKITIYDISGKIYLEKKINSKSYEINISELNAGTYFISFITNNNIYFRKFLIIK